MVKQRRRSGMLNEVMSDDILWEILIRLGDRETARKCTTVCKRWHSLMTKPEFIDTFKSRVRNYSSFNYLFRWGEYNKLLLPFYELSFDETSNSVVVPRIDCLNFLGHFCDVLASFDDLLLVSFNRSQYGVCNPFTKQWVALPPNPPIHFPGRHCGLVLKRDNNNNNVVVSFKVLLSKWDQIDATIYPAVFSSETGEWTASADPTPLGDMECNRHVAATSNGTLYWLGRTQSTRSRYKAIFAYDPYLRESRLVKLPVDLSRGKYNCGEKVRLGTVRGRLRMLQMFPVERRAEPAGCSYALKVWELDDECRWATVHDVKVEMDRLAWLMPLGFHPDHSNVVFFMEGGRDILRYEVSSGTCQRVGRTPHPTPDNFELIGMVKFCLRTSVLALPSSGPTRIPLLPPHPST